MRTLSFIFLTGLALVSCSSLKQFQIETQNPAQITFPNNVRTVLMVNNSAAQPDDKGYRLSIQGKEQDTLRIKADTALVALCKSLGKSLAESPYFEDVLLYGGTTRDDSNFLLDTKLSPKTVGELCEQNGADAIISVDRAIFMLDEVITNLSPAGEVTVKVTGRMNGTFRSYLPGRKSPLATVLIEDSVQMFDIYDNINLLNKIFPSPQESVVITAQEIGQRLTPNFIPYWQSESRWLYSGLGSKWKEAYAYASSEKWDKALTTWQALYDKAHNKESKAKLASNIALCHEMDTELNKAKEWSEKSAQLFEESNGSENKYTILQKAYTSALIERIASNDKLNMQFKDE